MNSKLYNLTHINDAFVTPLKIQGSKRKLIPWIRKTLPPVNGKWFEPFMGSGAVGFNVPKKDITFGDLNEKSIKFYNDIKHGVLKPDETKEYFTEEYEKLFSRGKSYFHEILDRYNETRTSLDYLLINKTCFNGITRINKRGELKASCGITTRYSGTDVSLERILCQMIMAKKIIDDKNISFKYQGFEETISEADPNDFLYCDPPYIGLTGYIAGEDSWKEENEMRLIELLSNFGGKFLVSTWLETRGMVNEYARDIWCKKFNHQTQTHTYSLHGGDPIEVTEIMFYNYDPEPSFLEQLLS